MKKNQKALTRKVLENTLGISVSTEMYDFKTPQGETYKLYHVYKRDHKGEMKELTPYIVRNPKSTYIQYQIQNISSYTRKDGNHMDYLKHPEYSYRVTAQRLFIAWFKGLDLPEMHIEYFDNNVYNYKVSNLYFATSEYAAEVRMQRLFNEWKEREGK